MNEEIELLEAEIEKSEAFTKGLKEQWGRLTCEREIEMERKAMVSHETDVRIYGHELEEPLTLEAIMNHNNLIMAFYHYRNAKIVLDGSQREYKKKYGEDCP